MNLNLRVGYFKHVGNGNVDITLNPDTPQADPRMIIGRGLVTVSFPAGDPNTPDPSVDGEIVTVTI